MLMVYLMRQRYDKKVKKTEGVIMVFICSAFEHLMLGCII